jgi:hypothetical protein
MTTTDIPPDFEAVKARQRAGWETGDYPRVGNTLTIMVLPFARFGPQVDPAI